MIFILVILLFLIFLIYVFKFVPGFESDETVEPCIYNLSLLPDVNSDNERYVQCRNTNSGVRMRRWYDTHRDITIEVTNDPVNWENVCSQYCNVLVLPDTCIEKNNMYDICKKELEPNNSCSVNPVAKDGISPVFIFSRGKIGCA